MTAHDLEMCQLLVAAGMPKADAVDIVQRIVEPYEQEVAKLAEERDAYRADDDPGEPTDPATKFGELAGRLVIPVDFDPSTAHAAANDAQVAALDREVWAIGADDIALVDSLPIPADDDEGAP